MAIINHNYLENFSCASTNISIHMHASLVDIESEGLRLLKLKGIKLGAYLYAPTTNQMVEIRDKVKQEGGKPWKACRNHIGNWLWKPIIKGPRASLSKNLK